MDYIALKHFHVTCVVLSGCGFFLRGLLMLGASPLLQSRPARLLPHVVDSLLLASAIALAVWSRQYPFVDAWLTAKVLGLLAYIGLGTIAIKRGRSRPVRIGAWLGALAVFGWIVSVALTRRPAGFLTFL